MKKKILYIHGAFSAYKPESNKVICLSNIFEVHGISYSMEDSFIDNIEMMEKYCLEKGIEFVAGTSMGGLYAAELTLRLNLKSILINPCVEPHLSLMTIVGEHTNFATGKKETLLEDIVYTYPEKAKITSNSIIFVGLKDELINPLKTIELYKNKSKIVQRNEDHYWEFFNEVEEIRNFINQI